MSIHTHQLLWMQFGVPLYGASIQGQVVHIKSNEKGCTSFGDDEFKINGANAIALVVRGGEHDIMLQCTD